MGKMRDRHSFEWMLLGAITLGVLLGFISWVLLWVCVWPPEPTPPVTGAYCYLVMCAGFLAGAMVAIILGEFTP